MLTPVSGEEVKDSRSLVYLEFVDISPGTERLFEDFKDKFLNSQSLEHWPTQSNTTYFDNLVYVLDKVLKNYGLEYEVTNPPAPASIKKPGGLFWALIK